MRKRFCAVNKFYNFLRSNKLAPIPVKLKVLEACVCSALLHNCETFGSKIPDDLEKVYLSLIKSCLGVRRNTPNKLVMTESNMPPIKSLIYSRQLNFITRFKDNLVEGSTRKTIYEELIKHNNSYLSHYTSLCSKYPTKNDITRHCKTELFNDVARLSEVEKNYKFNLYKKFNPSLLPPNLHDTNIFSIKFIRLRLSSHSFPIETGRWRRMIETGRWRRMIREERLCKTCKVLSDESHYIYDCLEIPRNHLENIPSLCGLQSFDKLILLLDRLEQYL